MTHPRYQPIKQKHYDRTTNWIKGTRKCYECGDVWHLRRECPRFQKVTHPQYQPIKRKQNDKTTNWIKGTRKCYECGDVWHLRRECPRFQQRSYQSSQQQSQHMNSSCIQGRQPQGEGNLKQKRLRDELDKAKAQCKEEFMHWHHKMQNQMSWWNVRSYALALGHMFYLI